MRKHHWWNDYNWLAPLYWYDDWCKRHIKKIKRILARFLAVCIGTAVASLIPLSISNVIADVHSKLVLQEELKQEAEKNAIRAEEKAKENEIRKQKLAEEKRQKAISDEIQRQNKCEEEIESEFSKYDRIAITWWDSDNGAVAPQGNSKVGQITKISGEYIMGTWGDYKLKWKSSYFHKITAKEYRELKNKELYKAKKKTKKWIENMSADEKRIYQNMGIVFNEVK